MVLTQECNDTLHGLCDFLPNQGHIHQAIEGLTIQSFQRFLRHCQLIPCKYPEEYAVMVNTIELKGNKKIVSKLEGSWPGQEGIPLG